MRAAQLLRNRNEVIIPWTHTPSCVIASKELTPTAKLIYGTLLKYAPNDKDECWPGLRRISTDIGMERQAVMNALKVLEANQLISIERRTDSDGSKTSNLYTILPFPDGFLQNGRTSPEKTSSPEEYEEDTPTYENHTTPVCKSPQEVVHVSEVKSEQSAPSVPRAPLATQTTRTERAVSSGEAKAPVKCADVNDVLRKMAAADTTRIVADVDASECWTLVIHLYKEIFGSKMGPGDRHIVGGKIKLYGHAMVAKSFYDVWAGNHHPDNLKYVWATVEAEKQEQDYRQVKKDHERLLSEAEVDELCRVHGIYDSRPKYFQRIIVLDADGNEVKLLPRDRKYRQLQRIVH